MTRWMIFLKGGVLNLTIHKVKSRGNLVKNEGREICRYGEEVPIDTIKNIGDTEGGFM